MKDMAAKDKKVTEITDMEVDFAQWFTDVCKKAQLIDYSSIKGVFIYRPYGYAIWENIQHIMDKEFKKQGVENVYMPLLIPESLLQKEKDHVEGFAPECAWVTMGGSERLEEKDAIRPDNSPVGSDKADCPPRYNGKEVLQYLNRRRGYPIFCRLPAQHNNSCFLCNGH